MGNSNGNLHMCWREFWCNEKPRLQGGFIWDMIDQGIRIEDKMNGHGYYYGYGGDFGDTINDLQFCINGLFSPDRDPHPAVTEAKYLQQPVVIRVDDSDSFENDSNKEARFVNVDQPSVSFKVVNRYSFRDLTHLEWTWSIVSNRSPDPVFTGSFQLPSEIGGVVELDLQGAMDGIRELEKSKPTGGNKIYLNINGTLNADCSWAKRGHALVMDQIPLIFEFSDDAERSIDHEQSDHSKLDVVTDDEHITVRRIVVDEDARPLLVISKKTGTVVQYSPMGQNVLADGGLVPNFTRASTDNDGGGLNFALRTLFAKLHEVAYKRFVPGDVHSYTSLWHFHGIGQDSPPHPVCVGTEVKEEEDGCVEVDVECNIVASLLSIKLFKMHTRYKVYDDGRVKMEQEVHPQAILSIVPSLPRIGMTLNLNKSLHKVQYFGRGPGENYPDRKDSALMGFFQTSAEEMLYDQYVVPGECGSRSDCDWVAFRSTDGEGVCCTVVDENGNTSPFSYSALLFSADELQSHKHMLPKRANGEYDVHANIDYKLMGLGGDKR
jgi:beta-galactosidase